MITKNGDDKATIIWPDREPHLTPMRASEVTQDGWYWLKGSSVNCGGWTLVETDEHYEPRRFWFVGSEVELFAGDLKGCVLIGPLTPPETP